MSTLEDPSSDGIVDLARALGRSRVGQIFGAIVVVALSAGVAWLLWNHRDFAAFILAMGVIYYGVREAWKLLPVPTRIRSVLAQKKVLWGALWLGCFMLSNHYREVGVWLGWPDFIGTLVSTAVVCTIIYLFDVRRSRSSKHQADRSRVQPAN
jgi:hypothetical protein